MVGKLLKRNSYTCLNPQIPGLVRTVGSSQATAGRSVSGIHPRLRFDSTVLSEEDSEISEGRSLLTSFHEGVHLSSEDIVAQLKQNLDIDVHRVRLRELYRRFSSNPISGLTRAQANHNLRKYGENILKPPKEVPEWRVLLNHILGGFSSLLLIGAALCFCATYIKWNNEELEDESEEDMYVGIVLTSVIFVSGICTYYQEKKTSGIIDSFQKMVPQLTTVLRNGSAVHLEMTDLVVGDIVHVHCGDKIPADIRLIECHGLKVDNSILTGDTEHQSRCLECTKENPLETKNLLFFGTSAVAGHAKGIVVNVGNKTVMGRIAESASKLDNRDIPVAEEVEDFVHIISAVAVFFGIAFFALSLSIGNSWFESVMFLIGIIVANVPEGLLATVTVCLALTAKTLVKSNCLVKHLEAVQTLGFISCICVDKTGILTSGHMTVSHMWFNAEEKDLQPTDYISVRWVNSKQIDSDDQAFIALSRAAGLCSRAKFKPDQYGLPIASREVIGDCTEAGILRCIQPFLGNINFFRKKFPLVGEVPFDPTTKFHVTIHRLHFDPSSFLIVMKGSPESVVQHCRTIVVGNKELRMTPQWKDIIEEKVIHYGSLGERVVAFCDCILPCKEYKQDSETRPEFLDGTRFRFLGLVSLLDPIKSSVPDAIEKCLLAGIKVVLMSGDHPSMVKTVARAVGILSEDDVTVDEALAGVKTPGAKIIPDSVRAIVIHGDELVDMDSIEIDEVMREYDQVIFSRTTPQQKLQIVETCQRQGWVTAVTGDGVMDSPALKKADIGVAMGIGGSGVAKDAADVILLDNNFSSLINGIEEGRLIFDNLKKCIFYTLTDNVAELAHFFVFLLTKIPLPLGTISILCLDLGTDIVPSVSLAYVKGETDVMKRGPRNLSEKLVTRPLLSYAYGYIGMMESFAGFFSYLVVMGENGWLPSRLLGIGDEWNSEAVNDLEDSYGQEWTFSQRKQLEMTSSTAYFVAIVVTQWSTLLICKTSSLSIFNRRIRNGVLNFALVFETGVALFLIYTPGVYFVLNLTPLKIIWWLPALPFSALIIFCDEIRRWSIRQHPHGWFAQEFFF